MRSGTSTRVRDGRCSVPRGASSRSAATLPPLYIRLMRLGNESPLSDSPRPARWLSARGAAGALVLGLTLWLLRSFVVPLIWATIVAVSSWPMYRRTARLFPDKLRAQWAPPVLAALITLLVLGPIVFAFSILAEQG